MRAKLEDRSWVSWYVPKGKGAGAWYELGVRPTLDRFLSALPGLKKAVASPRGIADGTCLPVEGFADLRDAA